MSLRILLGMDGSPYSQSAAAVALQIARSRGDVELTALHIVDVVPASGNVLKDLPGRIGFSPAVVSEEVARNADERGRTLLASVKNRGADHGIDVRTVLDHGVVSDRLLHHAAHADLLVLGTGGETETQYPGQGRATAYQVVSHGPCPALFVRRNEPDIRGVGLGYDGSAAAARTLSLLRLLGPSVAKPVHAVFVSRGGEAPPVPLERVSEELTGFDVHTHVVESDTVANGLSSAVAEKGCNTLAVGFSGRSKLRDFVFGRSIDTLVTGSDLNLLVAH